MSDYFISPFLNFCPSVEKMQKNILQTNEAALNYGLQLSEKDAAELAIADKESAELNSRIVFGESITKKLIEKFMKSSYISQNNYAETISALIDIFYTAKDESMDRLSDDAIINIMFGFFENASGGSIEVLQNRDMDFICRKIRKIAMNINDYDFGADEDIDDEGEN